MEFFLKTIEVDCSTTFKLEDLSCIIRQGDPVKFVDKLRSEIRPPVVSPGNTYMLNE